MNITNKDYFTFNVDNSVLLVGQTGSGKTELVRQLIRRLESAYSPNEMKYVIYDLKCCEFYTHGINGEMNLNGAKEEYLYTSVRSGTPAGFDYLDELAALAKNRAAQENPTPMLFIYIEECDLAATDQARFDKAVITINRHAKQANMKLIYSTSRPAPDVVSKEIIASFDLILSGSIHSRVDAKHLGIPYRNNVDPYSFLVTQHDDIYDANGNPRDMINLSDVDLSFGGENEPHDDHLSALLQQAYTGEIDCRRAAVPIELIEPFSPYVPQTDEVYTKRFMEAYRAGTPPDLYVYEKDGKFIMSDDYSAYYMYKAVQAQTALCTVIGTSTLGGGIEYGPPFKLQLPTLEQIS